MLPEPMQRGQHLIHYHSSKREEEVGGELEEVVGRVPGEVVVEGHLHLQLGEDEDKDEDEDEEPGEKSKLRWTLTILKYEELMMMKRWMSLQWWLQSPVVTRSSKSP